VEKLAVFGRRHQALLSLSKAADKAEDAIFELETQLQIAEHEAQQAGPAA
jgi:hypothetical protein